MQGPAKLNGQKALAEIKNRVRFRVGGGGKSPRPFCFDLRKICFQGVAKIHLIFRLSHCPRRRAKAPEPEIVKKEQKPTNFFLFIDGTKWWFDDVATVFIRKFILGRGKNWKIILWPSLPASGFRLSDALDLWRNTSARVTWCDKWKCTSHVLR
jgi:hypothetical protein